MLSVFRYTVLTLVREKWLILWAVAFPVILATLFGAMFSGLDETYRFTPLRLAVVADDAYRAAPGLEQTLAALSAPGDSTETPADAGTGAPAGASADADAEDADDPAPAIDGPLFSLTEVATEQEGLALVAAGEADGFLVADGRGGLRVCFSPATVDTNSAGVAVAVLDQYLHGVAEVAVALAEKPLIGLGMVLSGFSLDDAGPFAPFFSDAVSTERLQITHSDPDPMVRYYYALLGMAAGFSAQIAATAVHRLRADASALGARRSLAGIARWKMLVATFMASWLCALVSLCVAFAYVRFALGIGVGGREGWCVLGLAVTSFSMSAAGAMVGALSKEPMGVITAATCLLSLFSGLYGQASMNFADQVAGAVPWLSAVNPVWQCARSFYALLYYDSLVPFAQCCAVLAGMGAAFMLVAAVRLRRQSCEHL